jgi:Na+/H+ antiporter NhaD/arsenite permease-like protein
MDRFYIAAITSLAMVICTAATGMDLLLFALFACGIMLATGVLTRERAHKAIDWKIIITVAAAFGLSTAMTNTKVADIIGRAITDLAIKTNTGELGVLAVVMIFTEILCALITAKAGALLMFPIGASAAYRLGIDPTRMIIALMLGSSDYTTPQGHQTNLMVLGPGSYKFTDYQKLGIPLEIFLNIVQLICLAYYQVWWFTTAGAVVFLGICVVIDHVCVEHLPWRELVPGFLTCLCLRKKSGKGVPDAKDKSSSEDPEEEHLAGGVGTATGAGILREEDKASNVSMQMV